jgi:hypothetical protein
MDLSQSRNGGSSYCIGCSGPARLAFFSFGSSTASPSRQTLSRRCRGTRPHDRRLYTSSISSGGRPMCTTFSDPQTIRTVTYCLSEKLMFRRRSSSRSSSSRPGTLEQAIAFLHHESVGGNVDWVPRPDTLHQVDVIDVGRYILFVQASKAERALVTDEDILDFVSHDRPSQDDDRSGSEAGIARRTPPHFFSIPWIALCLIYHKNHSFRMLYIRLPLVTNFLSTYRHHFSIQYRYQVAKIKINSTVRDQSMHTGPIQLLHT